MEQLGLADFLTALHGELEEAQRRAAASSLKLGVGQLELELDVAYTLVRSGDASATAKARFWVLDFGEAAVSGSVQAEKIRTQHLKLVLSPRVEETVTDASGLETTLVSQLEVDGQIGDLEERPRLPAPPSSHN